MVKFVPHYATWKGEVRCVLDCRSETLTQLANMTFE